MLRLVDASAALEVVIAGLLTVPALTVPFEKGRLALFADLAVGVFVGGAGAAEGATATATVMDSLKCLRTKWPRTQACPRQNHKRRW